MTKRFECGIRHREDNQHLPALRGWAPVVLLPAAVLVWTPDTWPRWVLMWVLAVALFAGFKWLSWRRTVIPDAPSWRHAAYLFAWPGLDASAFLSDSRPSPIRPSPGEWTGGALRLLAGVAIFWGVSRLVPPSQELLLGWVGMVGVGLMLHFGSLHLLSCLWRSVGVEARPLMNRPLTSTSVAEFWGRRWNTGFRDLAHRMFFRPLVPRLGAGRATLASFVFSGLVHDLVISVPAGGGYGWPTLYFLLQALAVFFERSRAGRKLGLGRGWRGWYFTMGVLVLPAFGLFHPPFVRQVVVPFMRAMGALS